MVISKGKKYTESIVREQILEALQRLERLIETRSFDGSGGSQGGEHGGSKGRSWAQVAGGGAAGGTAHTGFNKNTATSSKTGSPSIAQGDPYEIRIRMNDPVIFTEIRQKPNTSEYILKAVNHQISQSGNINKDPQTTADTQGPRGLQGAAAKKWTRAAKMLRSGNIFLYQGCEYSREHSILESRPDWMPRGECEGPDASIWSHFVRYHSHGHTNRKSGLDNISILGGERLPTVAG